MPKKFTRKARNHNEAQARAYRAQQAIRAAEAELRARGLSQADIERLSKAGEKRAAGLLREIAQRDPEAHDRALAKGYGVDPADFYEEDEDEEAVRRMVKLVDASPLRTGMQAQEDPTGYVSERQPSEQGED